MNKFSRSLILIPVIGGIAGFLLLIFIIVGVYLKVSSKKEKDSPPDTKGKSID